MTRFQAIRFRLLGPAFGLARIAASVFLPPSVWRLRYGRPVRVRLPITVGWGQAVHPDVLLPEPPGSPFLLAFTPYPFQIRELENPSVVSSADGLRFHVERGGTNPLVPAPAVDHNDDPDILLWNGSYCLVFLETVRPEHQKLDLLQSTDRISWTRKTVLTYRLAGDVPEPFIVSPALSSLGGTLFLHYVNTSARPNRIEYLTSSDIAEWDKTGPRAATFDHLTVEPWHVDVFRAGGRAYMLLCSVAASSSGRKEYDLFIARSEDMKSWTLSRRPIFERRPFGTRVLYRSSGFVRNGDLFVYFSYESPLQAWWIGVVRLRLADFFPQPGLAAE